MNNLMNQLVSKLSEEEHKELKEYLFNIQQEKFKRNNLNVIRKFKLNNFKKETDKMLYDYIWCILNGG